MKGDVELLRQTESWMKDSTFLLQKTEKDPLDRRLQITLLQGKLFRNSPSTKK